MAKIKIYEKNGSFVGRLVAEIDSRYFFSDGGKRWEILDDRFDWRAESKATHFYADVWGNVMGLCRERERKNRGG